MPQDKDTKRAELLNFKMLKMWNFSSTLGRPNDEERERRRRAREYQLQQLQQQQQNHQHPSLQLNSSQINTLKAIKKRKELKKQQQQLNYLAANGG